MVEGSKFRTRPWGGSRGNGGRNRAGGTDVDVSRRGIVDSRGVDQGGTETCGVDQGGTNQDRTETSGMAPTSTIASPASAPSPASPWSISNFLIPIDDFEASASGVASHTASHTASRDLIAPNYYRDLVSHDTHHERGTNANIYHQHHIASHDMASRDANIYHDPALSPALSSALSPALSSALSPPALSSPILSSIQPFTANITSEVYLTYTTAAALPLHGHRFTLPKFVSVESAEILLSYFCEEMAPKFSVCRKQSSSLVCTYLPLAAYDPMVLAALLAWVALHFEKNGDEQFVPLKERLLNDVQRRLRRFATANTTASSTASTASTMPVEVPLATLLILIAIENKGTTNNWVPYYKMAQELIKQSANHGENTTRITASAVASSDFNWLKNNLIYHEVTAPSLLMLEDNPEQMESYFKYSETFDDLPEAYMGICRNIYKINRDIFRLSRRLVQSGNIEVLEQICQEAEVLEQRIEACKTLPAPQDMVLNGTLKFHRMFFCILKDTARLYIRQCVYMVSPVSIKSTMLVGRIITTIKKLFGTVMDPALLFPLFILGVDTVTKYVREWVISAMNGLYRRVGSGNILVAIQLLEKVWEQNQEGRVHVFWPQVAKENGLMVSLA